MKRTEVKCYRCNSITYIPLIPPLSSIDLMGCGFPDPLYIEHSFSDLSNLLSINELLGEQVKLLKSRLETYDDFMNTVFGESVDVVTLWQMSEIVSRIERLKNGFKEKNE